MEPASLKWRAYLLSGPSSGCWRHARRPIRDMSPTRAETVRVLIYTPTHWEVEKVLASSVAMDSCWEHGSRWIFEHDGTGGTVRTRFRLYREDGIEGLAGFGYEGGSCHLSPEQRERLRSWVAEMLPRTTRHVGASWIEREFAIVPWRSEIHREPWPKKKLSKNGSQRLSRVAKETGYRRPPILPIGGSDGPSCRPC